MSGETIDRELLSVHRTAHQLGVRSTAGMVFGAGESLEERVQHLFAIRELQEETGGFTAFTPWSFQPGATTADREEPTAVEYLRTLAIARMVLDNVENIESNCVAQGLKVVQMGLRFGANDTGSIRIESAAKRPARFTEEDLRRVIRDAGFRPVERDTLYQTMYLNN
jgi:cyclic dehypoxanthinyl futalosine synthase